MSKVLTQTYDTSAVRNETLGQKQERFAVYVSLLLSKAFSLGYQIRLGEVYRTPEQAELNAQKGIGIRNSLHTLRLAIDLNVFREGVWLQKSEQLEELGTYWESLAPDCRWGGRFRPKPDGNHFSIEHLGVK